MRLSHKPYTLLLLAVLALGGCTSLPSIDGRSSSAAPSAGQTETTSLGRAIRPRLAANPGVSGLRPLSDPREAFAARMLLARAAERSIDAQYYIWQNDITGTLLLAQLERAARRGVRVRLLVDDNGIHGLDDTLKALDAQPNFQVRLFNPFAYRRLKWANYATDFSRLNHRMHNKSFTVDNQATIIGGRNIGDIYFGATDGVVFADLDVMAIGPVVPKVSDQFDRYWASQLAYPIDRIVGASSGGALTRFHARQDGLEKDPAAIAYRKALATDGTVQQLTDKTMPLTWAPTEMISDPPAKALGQTDGDGMIDFLSARIAQSTRTVDLVSPYFVPGVQGSEGLVALARRGVAVRILTNSLIAADTLPVHAGYAKRRRQLLEAGIVLYELPRGSKETPDRDLTGLFGSSSASLHAKTFAIDGEAVFIGSFNLDPRSANLNTEMGFLIDSPALAQKMHRAFDRDIPRRAYRVYLDGNDNIRWVGRRDGEMRLYDAEPDTGWMRRMGSRLFSWLPIEWLL